MKQFLPIHPCPANLAATLCQYNVFLYTDFKIFNYQNKGIRHYLWNIDIIVIFRNDNK